MLSKIQENISEGRYSSPVATKHLRAWRNRSEGWIDYLLSEQVIFSHRQSHYAKLNFSEHLHAHDFYEMVICTSGENMQYVADNKHLLMNIGTVIVTAPMCVHMYRPTDKSDYDRYVIYFRKDLFREELTENLLGFLGTMDAYTAYLHFSDDDLQELTVLAQRIEEALLPDDKYSSIAALLAIADLFLWISRHTADRIDAHEAEPSPAPDFIAEIKQYIDEEYINIRSVSDLTEKFFYSREYITRVFKRYYNTPIYEYILNRKLLYTCSLLSDGMSVEKAAAGAGFHNMSSYIKSFKKFTGSTPSAYRQNNQHE